MAKFKLIGYNLKFSSLFPLAIFKILSSHLWLIASDCIGQLRCETFLSSQKVLYHWEVLKFVFQFLIIWNGIYIVISFGFIILKIHNIFDSCFLNEGKYHIFLYLCYLFPQCVVPSKVFLFKVNWEEELQCPYIYYLYQYALNLTLVYYNSCPSGNGESHHFNSSVGIWFKVFLSGESSYVLSQIDS